MLTRQFRLFYGCLQVPGLGSITYKQGPAARAPAAKKQKNKTSACKTKWTYTYHFLFGLYLSQYVMLRQFPCLPEEETQGHRSWPLSGVVTRVFRTFCEELFAFAVLSFRFCLPLDLHFSLRERACLLNTSTPTGVGKKTVNSKYYKRFTMPFNVQADLRTLGFSWSPWLLRFSRL